MMDDADKKTVPLVLESAPEQYHGAIKRVLPVLNAKGLESVNDTECFGHLWQDNTGICDRSRECKVATYCHEVYDEVNHVRRQPAFRTIAPKVPFGGNVLGLSTAELKPDPKLPKYKRGKYAGTNKYKRWPYKSHGWPVDSLVSRLLRKLGNPEFLPLDWNPFDRSQFRKYGRVVVARTRSYHYLFVDGEAACRFWTDAAACARVDIMPLIGQMVRGKIIENISEASARKHAPMKHRIRCESEADVDNLAEWIETAYDLLGSPKKKRKPKSS